MGAGNQDAINKAMSEQMKRLADALKKLGEVIDSIDARVTKLEKAAKP